ncbi:hypothetical protein BVAVS116_O0007 (plasmid) [Borreliella valaisiana VS116]|uniref:Uncharacterized protein n=1 Tax=Borreliella valaisiana VS116 TaxID=445987 RepID=C0R8B8_BORVA|nr:hypothetical protein [Borreliella valaisiana]ACN52702.1 hypothetical protein BVAVS116_O0007 [Borreliella valaisiana VS116]
MKKINFLIFLFLFVLSLSANIEKNYSKTKRAFSEEDFNLINKRPDTMILKMGMKKVLFFPMLLELEEI